MANIKDVAKLSGVGTSTVSRYFNKSGYIGKESKEKIEKACKTLNYKPNALARAVKTKRSYTICLVVPDISHLFYAELASAVEQACVKKGYKVLLVNVSNEEMLEELSNTQLHNGFVDGAIITKAYPKSETIDFHVPVVFMDQTQGSMHQHSYVYADDYHGGVLACEYLIQNGCDKIMYISNSETKGSRREKAYMDVMNREGLPTCIMELSELERKGYQLLKNEHYNGIFAWNDYTAASIIERCHQEQIGIPNDIQLVGYDNVSLAHYVYPQLTTIAQPIERLGFYAAETIINQIENNQEETVRIVLENKLVVRKSTSVKQMQF